MKMKNEIKLLSWECGLKKISLTNLIREYCGLSLRKGKDKVDELLNGGFVLLEILDEKNVDDFVLTATRLGANCEKVKTEGISNII